MFRCLKFYLTVTTYVNLWQYLKNPLDFHYLKRVRCCVYRLADMLKFTCRNVTEILKYYPRQTEALCWTMWGIGPWVSKHPCLILPTTTRRILPRYSWNICWLGFIEKINCPRNFWKQCCLTQNLHCCKLFLKKSQANSFKYKINGLYLLLNKYLISIQTPRPPPTRITNGRAPTEMIYSKLRL